MLESFVRVIQIPLRPLIGFLISGTVRARAVIIYQDEVLLARGWLGSQRWNLPGGGLKKGENAEAGIVRELHEELALTVLRDQLKFLETTEQQSQGVTISVPIFVLELADKPGIKIRKMETIEAKWFRINELPDNLNPVVKEAFKARKK